MAGNTQTMRASIAASVTITPVTSNDRMSPAAATTLVSCSPISANTTDSRIVSAARHTACSCNRVA